MPLQPRKRSKLFKEYAIADLSRYRQGRVGLRWRTQREVVNGTGQFACGAKVCVGGGAHVCVMVVVCVGVCGGGGGGGGGSGWRGICPGPCVLAPLPSLHAEKYPPRASLPQGCGERRGLASFEVPFAYQEAGGWLPCGPLVSGPAWAPAQRDQAAPHAWLACDGAGRCALVRWLAVRCAAPLPPWHPQGSGSRRW
jgi:hypothetical protein